MVSRNHTLPMSILWATLEFYRVPIFFHGYVPKAEPKHGGRTWFPHDLKRVPSKKKA